MRIVIAILVRIIHAYIRHLIKAEETFGIRLTTIHNLHFLLKLMEDIRQAIREDRLLDFKEEFFEQYGLNVENPKTFNKENNIMNVSALILPIILIIVFLFFLIRPQQKRAKEHREMISRIEAGQKLQLLVESKELLKLWMKQQL